MREVSSNVGFPFVDIVMVMRGRGDWDNYTHLLRAAYRSFYNHSYQSNYVGVRFVRGKR